MKTNIIMNIFPLDGRTPPHRIIISGFMFVAKKDVVIDGMSERGEDCHGGHSRGKDVDDVLPLSDDGAMLAMMFFLHGGGRDW